MKYKAGDKVRCVKPSAAAGVRVGKVFTVKGFSHNSGFGTHIALEEVCSTPTECVFELVKEAAVLTPEEVFKHLQKGTKLEFSADTCYRDFNYMYLHELSYRAMTELKWRVKPEPDVIELNGKKYREITD